MAAHALESGRCIKRSASALPSTPARWRTTSAQDSKPSKSPQAKSPRCRSS
jgi:hypothetical protein